MQNITFRNLEEKDLPDRVRWFSQKDVSQYLGASVREGTTLEKQREWFKQYAKKTNIKMFVIEADGKPVGNVALTEISEADSNAGLFIAIGERDYQGKGIGTKAIEFILNFGFNQLNLHKIWLYVSELNVSAINLYEKCGFEKEGQLKDMWKIDGKYYDEIAMAIFNPKDRS